MFYLISIKDLNFIHGQEFSEGKFLKCLSQLFFCSWKNGSNIYYHYYYVEIYKNQLHFVKINIKNSHQLCFTVVTQSLCHIWRFLGNTKLDIAHIYLLCPLFTRLFIFLSHPFMCKKENQYIYYVKIVWRY